MQRITLTAVLLSGALAMAQSPVPIPAFGVTRMASWHKGYWFTNPGPAFRITGVQVPNEGNQAFQFIEIRDLSGLTVPSFPVHVTGTQLFHSNTTAAGSIVPCNVLVPAGAQIGVLGGCDSNSGSGGGTHSIATPAGPFASQILGNPVTLVSLDSNGINAQGNRPVSQTVGAEIGRVQLYVIPATGMRADFIADVTAGASPLTVQFTDTSYSHAAGGITSWSWDCDGDSVVDSTQRHPTFVYGNCGTYNVSLTVTDATNPPSTTTRTGYIVTDNVVPSFAWTPTSLRVLQFTCTSTPTPTSWAWDFDGDNVIDSTVQHPVWRSAGLGCASATVRLTVNRLCRGPFAVSRSFHLDTPYTVQCLSATIDTVTNGLGDVGNLFDVAVHNPQGIVVCRVSITQYTRWPFDCDVYLKPGSYVGSELNAAAWRKVASGSGIAAAGLNPLLSVVTLQQPFYLPPGNYGMAVYVRAVPSTQLALISSAVPASFGNADLTINPSPASAPGGASSALFAAVFYPGRVWNGALHYSTVASGGDAGYGFFAPGCAGTQGIPGNTSLSPPRLGQTMTVSLTRLRLNAAFLLLGFSRTNAPFGALPFNMTGLGAPGCFGRVSPDAISLIVGAGNTASFNLSVPNNAIHLGTQLYTQALAIDTGFNVLGAVTSDAAALIVGQ